MPNDINSADSAAPAPVAGESNVEPSVRDAAAAAPEQEKPETADAASNAPETEKPADGKDGKKRNRRKTVKTILKWLGILFGVLLILLIIAVLFRNPIAKFAVRTVGTHLISPRDENGDALKDEKGETVKIKVDVQDIDSSLSGWVRVTGFSVDNPRDYNQERKAIEFKEVYVKIKIGSLFTNKIEVEEVKVDGLHVYCQVAATGTNLTDILNNIKANTASKKKKKKKKDEEKTEKQVVIRHLKVEDSSFDSNFLPPISLDMEKENIGEEGEGGTSWEDMKKWGEGLWQTGGSVTESGSKLLDKGMKLFKSK